MAVILKNHYNEGITNISVKQNDFNHGNNVNHGIQLTFDAKKKEEEDKTPIVLPKIKRS